jgi:Arc/MetJ-type ribon-helix-helix transcriptional regulator
MTIKVELRDEAARIVKQQIEAGHYPDAESAVTAALLLLEDAVIDWKDVDTAAVRRMIEESDAEGGETPIEDVIADLEAQLAPTRR